MFVGMNVNKYLQEYYSSTCHVELVRELSLKIFDSINKNLDELSEETKKLLEVAALLHDIGYKIDSKDHNKHSFNLIMQNGIEGFNQTETEIIAHVARYHRGALPDKTKHKKYAVLSKKYRKIIKKLSAILRLCDGLANICDEQFENLYTEFDNDNKIYTIFLVTKNKIEGSFDLNAAVRKKDLFEKIFHVQIIFKWV